MAAFAPPFPPTSDLVAVAWLSQRVAGLDSSMVATTLPKVVSWADKGFVQAQSIVGSAADIDLPQVRHPVIQVDCWAVNVDGVGTVSAKPAWGEANHLAELVRAAVEGQDYGRPVTLPATFYGARVQSVYMLSEPSRVTDDPSGYARYTLDLALDWVRV